MIEAESFASAYLSIIAILLLGRSRRRFEQRADNKTPTQISGAPRPRRLEKQNVRRYTTNDKTFQQSVIDPFIRQESPAATGAVRGFASPTSLSLNSSYGVQQPPQALLINSVLYQAIPVELQEASEGEIRELP